MLYNWKATHAKMIDKTDSGTEVQKMQMAEIDIDNIILQLLSVRDMPGRQVSTFEAATCDFQQFGILTSVDSDEPVQPPIKLRNSKWCSVSSLTFVEYSSD